MLSSGQVIMKLERLEGAALITKVRREIRDPHSPAFALRVPPSSGDRHEGGELS
jgi:hypothetical protein